MNKATSKATAKLSNPSAANSGAAASPGQTQTAMSSRMISQMSSNELQFFKELLLKQKSEILNKPEIFKTSASIESTLQGDEGDLAVSELNLSLSLRLRERQTQLLQKIDRALCKFDEGSFGLCEQCEESLNLARLKARPVATLCISCKEEQESKERLFA